MFLINLKSNFESIEKNTKPKTRGRNAKIGKF